MMWAMFAGENWDDWDDLLLAVMMAYHSSVHESTGFSPYCLMLYGSGTRWLMWLMTRSVTTLVRLCCDRSGSMIRGLSGACLRWEIALLPTS